MQKIPSLGMSRASMSEIYDRDRLGFLLAAARQHGPMVELSPGTILASGAKEAYEILTRSNRDFLSTQNFLRDKVDGNLNAPNLQRWMTARKAAANTLSSSKLLEEHQVHVRQLVSQKVTRSWKERSLPADQIIIDLQELTSNSISRFCFGTRDFGEVPERAQKMLDALFPIVASPFVLPRWLRVRPQDITVRRRLRMLEESVKVAAANPGSGGMHEALIHAGLSERDAVQMTISTLLAAHGVPASALLWTLMELAFRSDIQVALNTSGSRAELIGYILHESLRLWPPSWLLGRDAASDADCNGWVVPAGSSVIVSNWVVHRTAPSFAEEPEEFRPERWATIRPSRGEFIPFGAGPRWCIGERFALMELQTMLDEVTRNTLLDIDIARENLTVNDRRTLTPEGFILTFRKNLDSRSIIDPEYAAW